jgi:DNA-binding GntR family transcriptional regulator
MVEHKARALYARLRDDLIAGVYSPGEHLSENQVSGRYGVSRTPTREALSHLEHVGLLERVGAALVVPSPTVEGILDLFDVRTLLEGAIARYAAERRREGDLIVLRAAASRGRAVGAESPIRDRYLLNRSFHQTLSQAAHNPVLADQQRQLDLRVAALRTTTLAARGRWEASNHQHDEIVAAVADRDALAAGAAAERHLSDARALWLDLLARDRVPGLMTAELSTLPLNETESDSSSIAKDI